MDVGIADHLRYFEVFEFLDHLNKKNCWLTTKISVSFPPLYYMLQKLTTLKITDFYQFSD